MAKVQPLYGNRRYDWKTRLEALITSMGDWVMAKGEEGTLHTGITIARSGMRIVVESRIWGRMAHAETHVHVYGRGVFVSMMVKNGKLTQAKNILSQTDDMDDYRKLYKMLERRVYVMYSGDHAADIMSRGDDLYNIYLERRNVD